MLKRSLTSLRKIDVVRAYFRGWRMENGLRVDLTLITLMDERRLAARLTVRQRGQ